MLPIAKPYEEIEFRDEKHPIVSRFVVESNLWPFEKYIKSRSDLDMYSPGYEAKWKLENDKLFLIQLDRFKHTTEDLFNTNSPVFCEWFSGEIEFGVGTPLKDSHNKYNYHIWLKIENGEVIERKIISIFENYQYIKFGKYKGKRFYDVVHSKLHFDTIQPIKELINCYMLFLTDETYKEKIQSPYFEIDETTISTVKSSRNFGMNFIVAKNYIAINPSQDYSPYGSIAEKLSSLIERILLSDFREQIILTNSNNKDSEISEQSLLINSDIKYLIWAIKTVDFFAVRPDILNEEFELKTLKGFKINRLNSLIFEYKPIIETNSYKFSSIILELNQKKFEKLNNVTFDSENQLYLTNISKNNETQKLNSFFVDESYYESNTNDEYFNDNGRETYADYRGSYAQDYANFSDQFIDDVFDGDPDMYWNID